tara:strand:+ start:76 stop:1155 length:1080 start_codon:yes stop_codon:yes gene_type:complete
MSTSRSNNPSNNPSNIPSSAVGSTSKRERIRRFIENITSSKSQKRIQLKNEEKKRKEQQIELEEQQRALRKQQIKLEEQLKSQQAKLKEEKKTLELEKKQDNKIINFFNTSINNADPLKSVFQPLLDMLNTQVNTQISVISEPSAPARSPALARQPASARPSALARPTGDIPPPEKQVEDQIEKCYNKYIRTLASCITTQRSYSTDTSITIKLDNELTIIYSLMFITIQKKIVLTNFRSFIESINAILREYDRLIGDSNSTIGQLANSSMIAHEKKEKLTEITRKTQEYLEYYKDKSLNKKNIYSDLQIARNLLHRLQAIILIIITPDAKSKCIAHIATPNKGGGKTRKMINNSVKSKR